MAPTSKILVFSTQHMPTGGIESHLREFCYRMTESGVAVDLVILNANILPETELFFKNCCRNVYLYKHGRSAGRVLGLLWTGLLLNIRRYDAVYTNGQGDSIGWLSKFIDLKSKWVHHHHTAGDVSDQKTWSPNYKRSMQLADTVIACSIGNAKNMEMVLSRSIITIPCFSRDVSSKPTVKHDTLKFGYYGRLIPEKGIDVLCKLSNEPALKAIEIHIWGEGEAYPPSFFTAYPNIHYHGAFNGKEALVNIVSELDAYLLISTHPEGLPIALLEVMSAGLPWLATDRGGIPDIACDSLSTRIIPVYSSYDEIKSEVLNLAKDITSDTINKSLQKEFYAKKFSHNVLVDRWREVLGIDSNINKQIQYGSLLTSNG